jgi:hypothetical protein
MKRVYLTFAWVLSLLPTAFAAPPDFSHLKTRSELDEMISGMKDASIRRAIADHASLILAAVEVHRHVESVIRTIERAPGSFTKVNGTPDALKTAFGGDVAIFDTLTQVATNIMGGKAHDHRKEKDDPYNAAFIEHLGHIPSLEVVRLEASGIQDDWVVPILNLKKLKSLSISGFGRLGDASLAHLQRLTECSELVNLELAYFGKATDAGWEKLSALKNLETFTPRGAGYPGHFFAKYEGWNKLKRINFHSNGLDDVGFGYVCERFPNLEFIKLWHSKSLTDASAAHFKKLKHLTGIEISCSKASSALVKYLGELPMEYIALEYGVNAPSSDAIASVKGIRSLRRLKLSGVSASDGDLTALSSATQIEELSIGIDEIGDERVGLLRGLGFLKVLNLGMGKKKPLSPELQAKIRELLPKTKVEFQ